MNIEHFENLPSTVKEELLHYIESSYSDGDSRHSAYGLKQHYSSTSSHKEYHATTRCFMEAMIKSGYKATPVQNAKEPNWEFYLKVLNR